MYLVFQLFWTTDLTPATSLFLKERRAHVLSLNMKQSVKNCALIWMFNQPYLSFCRQPETRKRSQRKTCRLCGRRIRESRKRKDKTSRMLYCSSTADSLPELHQQLSYSFFVLLLRRKYRRVALDWWSFRYRVLTVSYAMNHTDLHKHNNYYSPDFCTRRDVCMHVQHCSSVPLLYMYLHNIYIYIYTHPPFLFTPSLCISQL